MRRPNHLSVLPQQMWTNRSIAAVIGVGLIHLLFVYGLLSGLSMRIVQSLPNIVDVRILDMAEPQPVDLPPPPMPDLAQPQVVQPALDPREGLQCGRTPGLDAALRQGAMRGVHLVDGRAIGRQHPDERGVDPGGIAQRIQAVANDGVERPATHVLQVDGDLGAGDVHAQRGFAAAS